ncbi:putative histidinol-phosphatase [Colletotrichum spaethianum]|uniref:Histidinol-phosphatase n=1 Tax=Colletotrichum spaethianum TaxID=700344 RepID=A0AA37L631_9PEZI|nr:putative histidinol-phosphatase [Colletotrichum spaethianum]GKT41304.1 putative histidinol-phosphatase [Colletotrichum spaethianum]
MPGTFEAQSDTSRQRSINLIFSNAADKIRRATDTEGCLFLDAAPEGSGTIKSPVAEDPTLSLLGLAPTSSDEETDSSSGSSNWVSARVLGFSTSNRHGFDEHEHITRHGAVAEKLLGTLIRRYPMGKLFTFHDTYGLHPTDSSEEDRIRQLSTLPNNLHPNFSKPSFQRQQPQAKAWAKQNEGKDILRIFPGARNVAFVPVWDPRKNRWYAGGFIYSRQPTRAFTVEGELGYLRVFGILAMTETLRRELILDEKTKFDALSSMSHELRSPLHGIILGIELLTDTDLSVTQSDIIHTLEASGRTLADTFDHLLDYAKVNNFQTTTTPLARGIRPGNPQKHDSIEAGMMTLNSVVQIDLVVEEVIDSIFSGFSFQHMSISQLNKSDRAQDLDTAANLYLDSLRAKEELGLAQSTQAAGLAFNKVLVLFDANPDPAQSAGLS